MYLFFQRNIVFLLDGFFNYLYQFKHIGTGRFPGVNDKILLVILCTENDRRYPNSFFGFYYFSVFSVHFYIRQKKIQMLQFNTASALSNYLLIYRTSLLSRLYIVGYQICISSSRETLYFFLTDSLIIFISSSISVLVAFPVLTIKSSLLFYAQRMTDDTLIVFSGFIIFLYSLCIFIFVR